MNKSKWFVSDILRNNFKWKALQIYVLTCFIVKPSQCFDLSPKPTLPLIQKQNAHAYMLKPRSTNSKSILYSTLNYGKEAETWPEVNVEPIVLQDSFPLHQIPQMMKATEKDNETLSMPKNSSGIVKLSAAIVFSTICFRLISFSDLFFSISFSGYLFLLSSWNRDTIPSLPPQGHIPSLVSNPLGHLFTTSSTYRIWLKVGGICSIFLPLVSTIWYSIMKKDPFAAGLVARPMYLICCQALSEGVSKNVMASLPFRIFIPLAYNTARLIPLWEWAASPLNLGLYGRILALFNLIYWTINLFAFLIPIATMKYMRTHFFCVEASEVTLKEEGETGAGLLTRT